MEEIDYPILDVGDVVLIENGGYGLVDNNEKIYCIVEEYSETGYFSLPGYLISKYEHNLVNHDYDNDWVGVETFGKKPLVLFNIYEKHVVDEEHVVVAEGSKKMTDEILGIKRDEYTGGSSNYYKVFVKHPTTLEVPYEAECADIIEALKLDFAEGNVLKALWRRAVARNGGAKKRGYDDGKYDAEKIKWFADIIANRYTT